MTKTIIPLVALCFLLSGCQGMFGTIPGKHWRVAVSNSDPKLEADSAAKIGQILTQRLQLAVLYVAPESKGWQSSFVDLANAPQGGTLSVVVHVNRSDSEIVLEVHDFSRSPDAEKSEHAMAGQVLSILKELYPNSSASAFIAYRGLLGP